MKPLICPQCGGKITDYKSSDNFAVCGYCGTRFVIEHKQQPLRVGSNSKPLMSPQQILVTVIACAVIILGGIIFIAVVATTREQTSESYEAYTRPTPMVFSTPRISPTPTPNPNLIEFGGKGTGDGLFKDADSIAVDKQGRIYVGDETLRVQQFDAEGKFLKLWQIPSNTKYYRRARTIQKLAVGDNDELYVLVGGTILLYENDASEPSYTFESAPSALQDFALRSDGGILILSDDGKIETLIFINKDRKVTKSIKGFHTETADASMSPYEIGLAAIRIAVDGANNIYSIYALGDLGSYQLSYNGEDFRIFRFNADGRYVNKFVNTMDSVGIETDNQSRIYISNKDAIEIYSADGDLISTVPGFQRLGAFALDKQNNIYILGDDKIVKRAAHVQ